ncbi:MAG TPA: hypothetical protein VNH22_00285 [Blastocatellia bacterium]|jgi:hypothetical protein|nr:hypothetical protein [Blastocatellia bacterium]
MAIIAIGAGILMTAVAVAIGGLALELMLLIMCRNCAKPAQAISGRVESSAVIHFTGNGKSIGAMEWAEDAAA